MRAAIGFLVLVVLLTTSPEVCAEEPEHPQPPPCAQGAHGGHRSPGTTEAKGPHDATVRHAFDDPDAWAKVFDDPARDAWQKPETVFDVLGVKSDAWVADLGAGTGYFTMRLARRVGPAGKVYGIDIEPSLVAHLRGRAVGEKLPNVEAILAAPDDPRLPDGSVDLVLVVDTWHHIDGRLEYLDRLRRTLRQGGRVAIVDFKPGEIPVGPPPEHRLAKEAVVAEFAKAGWELAASSDTLPYQYILAFVPKPRP